MLRFADFQVPSRAISWHPPNNALKVGREMVTPHFKGKAIDPRRPHKLLKAHGPRVREGGAGFKPRPVTSCLEPFS